MRTFSCMHNGSFTIDNFCCVRSKLAGITHPSLHLRQCRKDRQTSLVFVPPDAWWASHSVLAFCLNLLLAACTLASSWDFYNRVYLMGQRVPWYLMWFLLCTAFFSTVMFHDMTASPLVAISSPQVTMPSFVCPNAW